MPTICIISALLADVINTVTTSYEYEIIICHKIQPSATVSVLDYCGGNRVPNILFETYLNLNHFRIALYKFIIQYFHKFALVMLPSFVLMMLFWMSYAGMLVYMYTNMRCASSSKAMPAFSMNR